MKLFIAAQFVSVFAYALAFLTTFQKTRNRYLLFNMSASAVFGIHYLMLGALSGSFTNFLGVFRSVAFSQKDKNKFFSSLFIPSFFVIAYALISILTWQAWYSILPAIGMMIFTIGAWFNKVKYMRIFSLFTSVSWILYNIFVKSYIGIVIESVLFCTIIFSIVKIDILKKPQHINKDNNKADTKADSKL